METLNVFNTVKNWYDFGKIEYFTSDEDPLSTGSRPERITLDGFADYQQNPDKNAKNVDLQNYLCLTVEFFCLISKFEINVIFYVQLMHARKILDLILWQINSQFCWVLALYELRISHKVIFKLTLRRKFSLLLEFCRC